MSFDIPPMHIADDSPEAQVIEAIVKRDHVTPEEVVRRALRSMNLVSDVPENAVLSGRGLFGSLIDQAALNAAVSLAYDERKQASNRNHLM